MGWCNGDCGCGRNCKSSDDWCQQHECGKCEDKRIAKDLEMKNLKEENEKLKLENPFFAKKEELNHSDYHHPTEDQHLHSAADEYVHPEAGSQPHLDEPVPAKGKESHIE